MSNQVYTLSKGGRDGVLVLSVTGGQHVRWVRLAIEEVDDIEETFQSTVLEVLTNGDEYGRDTGSDTNGVLNIEILYVPTVSNNVIIVRRL